MELKIKKLHQDAIVPRYQTQGAAGFDICSITDAIVEPHKTVVIGSGLAFEIPHGYFGAVYARSGLGIKNGIRLANDVGIIDEDYRGEVKIALHNDSDTVFWVEKGMRCCQMIIQPYERCDIKVVDELGNTERGQGGLGSTGV